MVRLPLLLGFLVIQAALAWTLPLSSSHKAPSLSRPLTTRASTFRLLATARAGVAGKLREVKTQTEVEKIIQDAGDKLVVLDFTATWCGPCRLMAPVLEQLSEEFDKNAIFLKVDVDQNQETTREYEVFQMPTFILLKGGQIVGKMAGANPTKLKDLVAQYAKN